ncbi:two-component sensor histidine kinase [Erysipelatoclostridium sp. An15]|nr:two-component sensor histidine kinase [Erysipelatoclostridium sp. An15]
MMKNKKPSRLLLTFFIAIFTFFIMFITVSLEMLIVTLLDYFNVIDLRKPNIFILLFGLSVGSILIGTIVSTILSRFPVKPIMKLIEGMQLLANGHYETRIDLGKNLLEKDLTTNFNHLATELENTELLRSDFIDNFSHEFKTPIVSISGFAKILKNNDLPKKQQDEYLDIIVNESKRLTDMATNVLNLSKIEKQVILSDVTRFNLSEQIRNAIILLEKKWLAKKIEFDLDFNDYDIEANKKMLEQVWINLLDNAIKFSPEDNIIEVSIKQNEQQIEINISNYGPKILEHDLKRIFEKFYQGDTSHASQGTGIGLSIVSKIVALHKGNITVTSDDKTTFKIVLPIYQTNQ